VDFQTYNGQWNGEGGKYQFSFSNNGPAALEGVVEGDKLTITGEAYPLVFEKE